MISITKAKETDLYFIHQLAEEIWWPAYKGVISDAQISFMLQQNYTESALAQQVKNGDVFLLLKVDEEPKGFASFSKTDNLKIFKLHKLYLHPDQQGKGTGKTLLNAVEEEVKKLGANALLLNVNRKNKALSFYQKMGFKIVKEVDIPYFDYILDDYVMQKNLI